jgi:hypothetical protein
MGIEPVRRDFPDAGFRQVVVRDPDGVVLELNFPGE